MIAFLKKVLLLDLLTGLWVTFKYTVRPKVTVQYPEQVKPPPPPKPQDDPVATAQALERWRKEAAEATPPTWKVRVDTAAKTPCPT